MIIDVNDQRLKSKDSSNLLLSKDLWIILRANKETVLRYREAKSLRSVMSHHGRRSYKRKMLKMDASVWSGLPEQLFAPILAQLPLSSLFELRSVCKRWNSMLSDPRFLQTCIRASAEQQHHHSTRSRALPAIAIARGLSSSPGSSSGSGSAGVVAMDISALDRAHREARRRQHYYCMKFAQSSPSSYRLYMSLATAYYRRCFRDWAHRINLILSQR